jgi:RNA polymerase sigma-70 factor (ECF subfamily)
MILRVDDATQKPHDEGSVSDGALIERLCASDFEALGQLFDRYYTQVYRTAMSIVRDSAVADDIAQDCFLKLNQHAARIDTSLPLMPWLYRVTVNLSYSWVTRRQKRRISLEALVDQLMSPSWLGPEVMAEQGETIQRVQTAISQLPFNQQVVIALHYLSDLSLEEIAGTLEVPVGTVKSRLHYARENLRRTLGSASLDFRLSHGGAHGFAGAQG